MLLSSLLVLPCSHFFLHHFCSGSLRPCHCLEPVRLLFWLLVRLVDGLAPSACAVRCPHGSTMRFPTMSCVYSTHHSLHALNSVPSCLQRIPLALSSLLLFLFLFAPPESFPLLPVFLAPLEPSFSPRFSLFLSSSS